MELSEEISSIQLNGLNEESVSDATLFDHTSKNTRGYIGSCTGEVDCNTMTNFSKQLLLQQQQQQ